MVRINGYRIDVTRPEPVPAELDVPELQPGRGPAADAEPLHWIVQLRGPVGALDRRELAQTGARIGDYLPDFAYVATMDRAAARAVGALGSVRGITRYRPAYKVHRGLKDGATGSVAPTREPTRVHVRVDEPQNVPTVLAEVHRQHGTVTAVSRDLVTVLATSSAIARLARLEPVLWIEPAIQLRLLNDTSSWTIQTYVPDNRSVWDHGLHGERQTVGLGDTGVDHDMCFFRDPAGAPIGAAHRKIIGYVSYADDYDGNMGHGSHVAGTIAGNQAPITGASTANGMAPMARLFVTDLTPGEQNVVYLPADLGDLFGPPYAAGARLHSDSWGSSVNMYDSNAWSADRFAWEHKDFLALFANGNDGPGLGSVGAPATAKNVVSVGATENGIAAEDLAFFSSHGPGPDGRTKPTLTAPGVAIVSADSDGARNSYNCGTVDFSGTSMATPTVAGAAALVRQYFAQGYWPHGVPDAAHAFAPSGALVKSVLVNSAQSMGGAYIDAAIPSAGQGWGRVNLSNTLRFAGDPRYLEVFDVEQGLETGSSWTQTFYSSAERPLKVTLVWTDYPASASSETQLVNDLDLTVIAPDGTTYAGNGFSDGASVPGTPADHLNVEEQVLLGTHAHGRYTVRVTGHHVPYGPQPFAVVVTGGAGVTSTGFIGLDKNLYGGEDTIRVEVSDVDLNLDVAVPDSTSVSISAGADVEVVTLTETGPSTGVFVETLRTTSIAVPADGALQVTHGDVVVATYLDADDGSGVPVSVTATARIDLQPPVLSGVGTGAVGQGSATVAWTTDEPTTAIVEYGLSRSLGAAAEETWLTTAHTVQLPGLREASTYYYAVRSVDEAGNVTRETNGGPLYTFTTANLPPDLTVYSSNSAETYQSETVIFGTALDPSGVTSVTVNGVAASYRSTDGYYERTERLSIGQNTFEVAATDGLGNVRTLYLTVNRSVPPDLLIAALAGPPRGGVGESIHVDQTVCNIGQTTAPGTGVMAWFLSVDDVISPDDDIALPAAFTYGDDIPAGACVPIAVDVSLPMAPALVGRTYLLGAYVDYRDQILESDESNNGRVGGPITIEGPDLAVTAVTVPSSAGTTARIILPTTVANFGMGGSSGFAVAVYLSPDAVITPADVLLASGRQSSLGAGRSVVLEFTTSIPSSVAPGTYYVGAIADPGDEVLERNEANNALAVGRIEVIGPDLLVTAVTGPSTAALGGTMDVMATVAARDGLGGTSDFVVGLYLSSDELITSSDHRIGGITVRGLPPGSTSTQTTTVVLPTTLSVGTYHLGAIADDGDVVRESDETNNAMRGNTVSITGPDLFLTDVRGPTSALPGSDVVVTANVGAKGTVSGSFHVGVFLSTDQVITSADTFVGSRRIDAIATDGANTEPTTVRIPGDLPEGTYYVGAIVDDFSVFYCDPVTDVCAWDSDLVHESDETNNAAPGNALYVGRRADLAPIAVTAPPSAEPGATIDVTDSVVNAGTIQASSFRVGIYLSPDAVITSSDVLLGTRTVASLAPGAMSTAITAVRLPLGLAPGTYFLGAIADVGGIIVEATKGNNALAANSGLSIGRPDLIVTAVSGPSTAAPGSSVSVTSTVGNTGALAAGSFRVGLYLSNDAAITTSDTLIGARTVAALGAASSSTETTVVTIPAGIAGTYYLGAVADDQGTVAEGDEGNNAAVGGAMSIGRPDLVVTAVSGPSTAAPGSSVGVTSTVENTGALAAGSFRVGLYLSNDAAITTSDTLIGARTVAAVGAASSSTETTVVTIPAGIAGTYYLGAVADDQDTVAEGDEGNNAAVGGAISIGRPDIGRPDLIVTAVSGPSTAAPGSSVSITYSIANAGTADATGFAVAIYLSKDTTVTTGDRLMGSWTVSSLAPGETYGTQATAQLPAGISPGSYYYGVVVDALDVVPESDETNNARAGNRLNVKRAR